MVLHPMLHPALLPAHPLRPRREHSGSVGARSLLSQRPRRGCAGQRRRSRGGRMRLAAPRGRGSSRRILWPLKGVDRNAVPWKDYLKGTNRSDELVLKQISS